MHFADRSPYLKYWQNTGINAIEDNNNINYCLVCINALITYYNAAK